MYKLKQFHIIGLLIIMSAVFGVWLLRPRFSEWTCIDCENVQRTLRYVKLSELDRAKYNMGQFEVRQPYVLAPGRTDVLTVTPWLAPIVWEGTFDPKLIDSMHKPLNITIASAVFAMGKYIRLLKPYLESAEKHYLIGYKVHYYVLTDQADKVPHVALGPGRSLTIITIPGSNRWQDICMRRMEFFRKAIEDHQILLKAQFMFCTDVDMVWENHFGAEVLGELVAVIHPGYYATPRGQFTYERRKTSQAYIPPEEGDFYYAAAFFGGHTDAVYRLTKDCEEKANIDRSKNIEAIWQEESHMNRYFILNKPTKLLSPEYLWDKSKPVPKIVRVVRYGSIVKNYADLRPNWGQN